MNIQNIKLIIWDLDETLWRGTISEGEVEPIAAYVKFVRDAADMGIVHSICSKNDFETVRTRLTEMGMWDFFVFPSIDWTPKGSRIKKIIDTMRLRYVNVLFVDDNLQNLEEAKHFCPGIMTALPDELSELCAAAAAAEHKDPTHKRLQQYRVMEEKENLRGEFESNEDFLYSCNIKAIIEYDCQNHIDRIADLIIRSNQLNYTKIRLSKDELSQLLCDGSVRCGYVSVHDSFGDYGIVGFFAVRDGRAIHFVFSCRVLGMQVEQYVYSVLGCPEIEISGDVAAPLRRGFVPPWINGSAVKSENNSGGKVENSVKILLKGPCDMLQMHSFLSGCKNLTTEFAYTNEKGIYTEGHNHTSQLVTALYASDSDKARILESGSFFDPNMLDTSLLRKKYDYVVLSMLTDGNLGIYRHSETGFEIALCEKYYALTDEKWTDKYTGGELFCGGIRFTEENLAEFHSNFTFCGNSDFHKSVENLEKILAFIGNDTKLILLLGSEKKQLGPCPPALENRHLEHARMNRLIEAWANGKPNVTLIHYDKYIRRQSDFLDTINHFSKRVYYSLAADLVNIFGNDAENGVRLKGKSSLYISDFKQRLRDIKNVLIK